MDFPANALIATLLGGVEAGRLLRYEGEWYQRLPTQGVGDPSGYAPILHLTGSRSGVISWESSDTPVLALAPAWNCELRIDSPKAISVLPAIPGTLCISSDGPVVYAVDGSERQARAIRWSDGANVWSNLLSHGGRVVGTTAWRAVLTKEGHFQDGPELFRFGAAN
jgi:hypothetical protein